MSFLFDKLEVGQEVQMKGPLGSFIWLGRGEALWRERRFKLDSVGLICGGSGTLSVLLSSYILTHSF